MRISAVFASIGTVALPIPVVGMADERSHIDYSTSIAHLFDDAAMKFFQCGVEPANTLFQRDVSARHCQRKTNYLPKRNFGI